MSGEFDPPIFSVSISGVSDKKQIREIHKIRREEGFNFSIAIGYQASHKSINQGTHNPRQPRFSDLEDLSEEAYILHFITAVHYFTKDNETILPDLEKIRKAVDPKGMTLLQLNTLPPKNYVLRRAKEMLFEVILPVAVSNKQSPDGGYAVWKGREAQDVKSGDVDVFVLSSSRKRACY